MVSVWYNYFWTLLIGLVVLSGCFVPLCGHEVDTTIRKQLVGWSGWVPLIDGAEVARRSQWKRPEALVAWRKVWNCMATWLNNYGIHLSAIQTHYKHVSAMLPGQLVQHIQCYACWIWGGNLLTERRNPVWWSRDICPKMRRVVLVTPSRLALQALVRAFRYHVWSESATLAIKS